MSSAQTVQIGNDKRPSQPLVPSASGARSFQQNNKLKGHFLGNHDSAVYLGLTYDPVMLWKQINVKQNACREQHCLKLAKCNEGEERSGLSRVIKRTEECRLREEW